MSTDFVSLDIMKRIANDDAFRRHLESDPVRALSEAGITLQGSDIPQQILLPTSSAMNKATTTSDIGNPAEKAWLGFIG